MCLSSSPECLASLTEQAIEQSSEIAAIEEQLALTDERQDYAESRRWTNYLTLDPLRLVQNVLGGGDVQRDRLAIASLELEGANLIRRREAIAENLAREVVEAVLNYERLERELSLIDSQLMTHLQRVGVMEASYRTGQGSTTTMLSVWQRTEELSAALEEKRIAQSQVQRGLEVLTNAENLEEQRVYSTGSSGGDRAADEPIPESDLPSLRADF